MTIGRIANRAAPPLALVVLAAGAWFNWRAWLRGATEARNSATVPTPETWPDMPSVSVLVAAWNEAAVIERHIRSFLSLRYPGAQLVLCAGGEDATYATALGWADERIRVLKQLPGEGKQRALGRCLRESGGDILVLTDADCLFEDVAFERLLAPLAAGEADVVTGYAEPWPEQLGIPFVRYQWLLELGSPAVSDRAAGVLGRNCALRRTVVAELGAFDVPAATGTDYVLSQLLRRAKYPIRAVRDSRVPTRYPVTAAAYVRMWRRWIKNLLIHAPRFGDFREAGVTLVAVGLATGTLATPFLTPVIGRVAIIGPLTALGLATMNRLRRVALGARRAETAPSWPVLALTPGVALLDMLAVLLAAFDSVSRDRRSRW